MAALETVSAEDLRQVLAEVDEADAAQRLMAAITFKELDDLTQGEAAALYGFPVLGPQNGSTVSNGSTTNRLRTSSMMSHDLVDRQNSASQNISGSWMTSMNRLKKPVSTHVRGRFCSPSTISIKNSTWNTPIVISDD